MNYTNPCSVMYLSCLRTATDGEVTVSFHASSKAVLNDVNLLTATSSFTSRLNKSDNGVSSAIFSKRKKTKERSHDVCAYCRSYSKTTVLWQIEDTRTACRRLQIKGFVYH